MQDSLNTGKALNTFILVRKATDFRVTADFAWYAAVLRAVIDKDPSFDTQNLILGITFANEGVPSKEDIEKFWKKLFESSGLIKDNKLPSADRTIYHYWRSSGLAMFK